MSEDSMCFLCRGGIWLELASRQTRCLNGNQIGQNLVHETDRQGIVPGTIDHPQPAVWQARRDLLSQAKRKRTVFCTVPKPHRNINIFQSESPSLGINLRVDHDTFGRAAPGATCAFEAGVECGAIAQDVRIYWLEYFQKQRAQLDRNTPSGKGSRHSKTEPEKFGAAAMKP